MKTDPLSKCITFLENIIDIFGYQVECCRENEGWSAYCVKHIKYDDIPENTSCSICMENVSKYKPFTLTNCKHYFHRECFYQLKRFSDTCPMCRADLDSPPLGKPPPPPPLHPHHWGWRGWSLVFGPRATTSPTNAALVIQRKRRIQSRVHGLSQ